MILKAGLQCQVYQRHLLDSELEIRDQHLCQLGSDFHNAFWFDTRFLGLSVGRALCLFALLILFFLLFLLLIVLLLNESLDFFVLLLVSNGLGLFQQIV